MCPKFSAATFMLAQVVSNVSLLMFLDIPTYSPVHVQYFHPRAPYVVLRDQLDSLLSLVEIVGAEDRICTFKSTMCQNKTGDFQYC